MSFYSGLQNTASRLLLSKGQPLIIRRKAVVSKDPVVGSVTTSTAQDFTVNGVLVNYGTMLVAEGAVQSGDRLAIIEAGVVAPSKDDQLVAEGRIWTIVDFTTVSPGGTAIIYKLQVRS